MFIVESRVADAASRPAVGASYSSAAIPINSDYCWHSPIALSPESRPCPTRRRVRVRAETTTLSQPASSSQCLEPAALPLTSECSPCKCNLCHCEVWMSVQGERQVYVYVRWRGMHVVLSPCSLAYGRGCHTRA